VVVVERNRTLLPPLRSDKIHECHTNMAEYVRQDPATGSYASFHRNIYRLLTQKRPQWWADTARVPFQALMAFAQENWGEIP